jgi:hypothetical protein
MRRLRHLVSRLCEAISAVLEPSAVLRLVRGPVKASAHGARVREHPRRIVSYVLGWASDLACTDRIQLHAVCLHDLVREGVPGETSARRGATVSSS